LGAGSSLLAAGAVSLDGRFGRGDVVNILHEGRPVARGLAEYDADDAAKILGLRSEGQAAVLGYAPRSALVHRDHLVLI
jgi:glutamate 5-kinase